MMTFGAEWGAQYGSDKGKHTLYPLKHYAKCCSEWLLHVVVVSRLLHNLDYIYCLSQRQPPSPYSSWGNSVSINFPIYIDPYISARISSTYSKTWEGLVTGCFEHASSNRHQIRCLYLSFLLVTSTACCLILHFLSTVLCLHVTYCVLFQQFRFNIFTSFVTSPLLEMEHYLSIKPEYYWFKPSNFKIKRIRNVC